MDEHQEKALWASVIEDEDHDGGPINIEAIAQQACDAWRLLHDWQVPRTELDGPGAGTATFIRWADEVARRCQRLNWLDPARLPTAVLGAIRRGEIAVDQHVTLAGFDELAPVELSIVAALEEAGTRVGRWYPPERNQSACRVACANRNQELRRAARWARDQLQQDPEWNIGVLVPDLASRPSEVERVFRAELCPRASPADSSTFALSLGRPLSEQPIIHSALLLLRVLEGKLSLAEWGLLLRSPFVRSGLGESNTRALLDVRLRRLGRLQLSLAEVSYFAAGAAQENPSFVSPDWVDCLSNLAPMLPEAEHSARVTPWLLLFNRALEALGWPGERTPSSREYQAMDSWRRVLQRFSSLDPLLGGISFARAHKMLADLCQRQVFQPQAAPMRLEISGFLESAGATYDKLWVVGMSADAWPTGIRPSPYLPLAVQNRHQLPRCDPHTELEYCRRLTRRLIASATEVTFSWARQLADAPQQPSPLILHLDELSVGEGEPPGFVERMLASVEHLQVLTDDPAPSLPMGIAVKGGAGVLARQSLCPFRAFAEYRLAAKALESPGFGISPALRGQVVHKALQLLWEGLDDQHQLRTSTEAALGEKIDRAIGEALRPLRRCGDDFLRRNATVEAERLRTLLRTHLEYECRRAPFSVVGVEERQTIKLDRFELSVRLDRVDRLESGGLAIVDYKTGTVGAPAWAHERPGDLQLLVYALGQSEPVSALCYAFVRTGELCYHGVAQMDEQMPGMPGFDRWVQAKAVPVGSWQALLEHWQSVVRQLADEFADGDLRILHDREAAMGPYAVLSRFASGGDSS